MKAIFKKIVAVVATVSVISAMSVASFATSFNVYQTGAPTGSHLTSYISFPGSKTSVYAYCSTTTNSRTQVVVSVPGGGSWTLSSGQGRPFSRGSTEASYTCTVTLKPVTTGAESAQGTLT